MRHAVSLYDRFALLAAMAFYAVAAAWHGAEHGSCWCEVAKDVAVIFGLHGAHRRLRPSRWRVVRVGDRP